MHILKSQIERLKQDFLEKLNQVTDSEQLEGLRVEYLGRTGKISDLMHQIKALSLEDKKEFGPVLNSLKNTLTELFDKKQQELALHAIEKENYKQKYFDVTAYKKTNNIGSLHPHTLITEQIQDLFISMGYEIAQGPEVETEFHNFDALNIPKEHPARDLQDTFWLNLPSKLLRTHTSTVQIHSMLNKKPPIAVMASGRVYRNEATDATHDFMFSQVEALLIDKNISIANLIATIKYLFQALFEKKDLNIRIRPSYFPFVEPGVEVDMTCPFCKSGCPTCKRTGWIEMGGAGLVHPNVLNAVNINSQKYNGFAFGFGLTRLIMLKYGIPDIRLLHSNKIDFLKQF